jgi:hypothetical protein
VKATAKAHHAASSFRILDGENMTMDQVAVVLQEIAQYEAEMAAMMDPSAADMALAV